MTKFPALMLSVAIIAGGAGGALAADAAKSSAQKMTKAQCETLWKQAGAGASGDLTMDKAKPYAANFKDVDVNGDSKLSSTEWMDGCNKGLIRTAAAATPAGKLGAPTSDRTPGTQTPDRTPGASNTGAAGTERGITPGGTSDRTPSKQ